MWCGNNGGERMSFADRVRQSQTFNYTHDEPSGITQVETTQHPRSSIMRFNRPTTEQERVIMQDAGYKDTGNNKDWRREIRFETRMQDRLLAERVYAELCNLTKESPNRVNGRG